jgi:CDP-diacylglycerol pyrophosphatase
MHLKATGDHPVFEAMKSWIWVVLWLTISALILGPPIPAAHAADPSALWNITSGKCVPDMRDHKNPGPCAVVDLDAGFVILKDIVGATQFLAIPTVRLAGIEDPAILAPDAPNYWDRAWRERALTEHLAGKPLPREALSLAINSAYGRSQNQLHIHIDCVRKDVRDALAAHRDAIDEYWSAFPVPLAGHQWRAFRVNGRNLGSVNPFRLLAVGDPDAAAHMGRHTLVVVGMTWPGDIEGFAVMDGEADLLTANRGSGEALQDHDCALAR